MQITTGMRRWLRRAGTLLQRIGQGPNGDAMTLVTFNWGTVEAIEVEPCGVARVRGWARLSGPFDPPIVLHANGVKLTPLHTFRLFRPDVARSLATADAYLGFVTEYAIPPEHAASPLLELFCDGNPVEAIRAANRYVPPAYETFLSDQRLMHREDIYLYGPPAQELTDPETLAALEYVTGPALDVGCGLGLAVRHLRGRGIDATGIELDRPAIAQHLPQDVRPFVRLYDGSLPLPFVDDAFSTVVCLEVLEHIPEPERMLAEIARVGRDRLVLSVPDISAIPFCFPSGVVPWHLLEGTHINFFTQETLSRILSPHYRRVAISRLHLNRVNDTSYYTNLLAVAEK